MLSNVELELIERREIRVNSWRTIVCHPNVVIWEVDCESKRPQVNALGGEDLEVLLYADEHTLRKDESTDRPTVFRIDVPSEKVSMFLESARYTVRIAIYTREA